MSEAPEALSAIAQPYLRIDEQHFTGYIDARIGEPLRWLGPLARINVLVGATNAGKSRFLRALAREAPYVAVPKRALPTLRALTTLCERWGTTEERIPLRFMGSSEPHVPPANASTFIREIHRLAEQVNDYGQFTYDAELFRRVSQAVERTLGHPSSDTATMEAYASLETRRRWLARLREVPGVSAGFEAALRELRGLLERWIAVAPCDVATPDRIYIPTLRSAVRLFDPKGGAKIDEDVLEATFRMNYNWGLGPPDQQPEVFTGNRLAWAIQQERGGTQEDRERLRRFEGFLAQEFFGGRPIELVPRAETKDEHQRLAIGIAGQPDRLLHELGDGIQAIIILMYRLFTAERGSWLFIEEPELNLHPGLQRIFLHALANNAYLREQELRVFLTTHSNHLLGTLLPETTDVSAFSFQERAAPGQFVVRPVLDRDHNALTLLGVHNSSVLLANCSIWVEGISDRIYLRAYLRAYQDAEEFREAGRRLMREDIHYGFLEYAGSNLAHYLFDRVDAAGEETPEQIRALALCNRIFLLADRDEGKEEKHARLRAAADASAGQLEYHITVGIEIENMIPAAMLLAVLPQLVRDAPTLAIEPDAAAYRDARMGSYLRELLGPTTPGGLAAESGTLTTYYKHKLAGLVAARITWAEMNDAARELTLALYAFIERHNR